MRPSGMPILATASAAEAAKAAAAAAAEAAAAEAAEAAAEKAAAQKKTSITCVKGKTITKVTKVNPVCPKGYTKKK